MNAEHRVLINDSDLNNCKAIKYALTEYGIGAYYTLSVIDGIERLNRHNYELVILDISLSETDGLQLLRFMRQMRNMPNLVLSSQAGRVLTHEQLRYYVWGDDFVGDETNAIPSSVSRLRQKLGGGDCIENIRGVGYRFNDPAHKKK